MRSTIPIKATDLLSPPTEVQKYGSTDLGCSRIRVTVASGSLSRRVLLGGGLAGTVRSRPGCPHRILGGKG
jgi:hypothetical protein